MRGLSNLPFFRGRAPKPPPKDAPKPAISAPLAVKYQGGKSAQGGVIDLAHNPNPPHLRPSIPAGPQNAPARPAAGGHDLEHMNISANASSVSLASSLEKPLPALPPGASPAASESDFRGSVPWLRDDSPPGSIRSVAQPGSMIPDEQVRREGSSSSTGSHGSMSEQEARQVGHFWNGLDRHIENRLGPGNDHDMRDLLQATDNPMFRLILNRHPAIGGMERPGAPGLPQEFRNAPIPETRAAPHRPASGSEGPVSEERALWQDMRRQAADRKRNGEGQGLP